MDTPLHDTLSAHRPMLLRWFTRLSGDPQVAEDLTQETLVEAWTHRDRLTDTTGARHWLNAIGANVYKRWRRRRGIEARRLADLDEDVTADTAEFDLDRDELARLLDSALELLSPENRALLTARYLDNVPSAELARRLGVSESAAAVRLHRGRLMLRKLVNAEMNGHHWQSTSLWCMTCGQAHYEGRLDPITGDFFLYCPRCGLPTDLRDWDHQETGQAPIIRGMKSIKPALYHLMAWNYREFQPALVSGIMRCSRCGRPAPLHRRHLEQIERLRPDLPGAHMLCPHCGHINASALSGIGLSSPEGIGFVKTNPRIHQLPIRQVEHQGREALVLSWQSLPDPKAELAVIFAQDTYEILSIDSDGSRG